MPLAERQSSGLPIRSGRFDSDMALCFALVIYRCGPTVSQLPLKQFIGGSNPSACAVSTNQYSGVATVGRCVWLWTRRSQVRFLPPVLWPSCIGSGTWLWTKFMLVQFRSVTLSSRQTPFCRPPWLRHSGVCLLLFWKTSGRMRTLSWKQSLVDEQCKFDSFSAHWCEKWLGAMLVFAVSPSSWRSPVRFRSDATI